MPEDCKQERRITRIEDKIDKMVDAVSDVVMTVNTLAVNVNTVLEKTAEQERTLKGSNGTPGVVSSILDIKDKISKWESNLTWLTRTIIGLIVTAIFGGIVLFLQILPLLQELK